MRNGERETAAVNGCVFQVQRWSVQDGDGIRSTVFLKGCPLRCRWCANPESWNPQPEVMFFREKCSGCGRCVPVCDTGAAGEANQSLCRHCGACARVCPSGARQTAGRWMTVEEVVKSLQRDAVFYRESGGGVTFSGGEPFAQPEFLRQLVKGCVRLGLDTAVETCGCFDWDAVQDIVRELDCAFVDVKHMDDAEHRRLTGSGNCRILENVSRLARTVPRTIVRVPLIAGVNDGEENLRALCGFLRADAPVAGVELLPYHDLGVSKGRALGREAELFAAPARERIEALKKQITGWGIPVVDYK